jgi:predicted ATPase
MGRSNIFINCHHHRSRTWNYQAGRIDELFSWNEVAQLDLHHTYHRESILHRMGLYALAR